MRIFAADQLRGIGKKMLQASGAPENEATTVADLLVEANLRGQDGHGILMLQRYLADIKSGRTVFPAEIEIVSDSDSSALINGNRGFGQVIGEKAMELAINKARGHTIGLVGAFNCNHIGMLAHYTMMALKQNMIGITICNSSPEVAPYGGKARKLGTNPLSIAIPAGKENPIVLDMATSVVAAGKIRTKYAKGEKLPEGWIIDEEGRPTVDPSVFVSRKGMLLPIGGYKGYGLSVIIDSICGALTGTGCSSTDFKFGNGVVMCAINIESFTPIEVFKERVDSQIRSIRDSPIAPNFNEILMPGEPEFRTMEERTKNGIEIADYTWEALKEAGKELGITVE